jgi:hypothetical protein
MIGIRGAGCLVDDQERRVRVEYDPAGTDFRTLDQSIEGLQRSQFIMLRVDDFDALDRGLQRQRQASGLQKIYGWIFLPSLLPKLDACELVNRIPQLGRIVLDGTNDAGKNYRKVKLRWSHRTVLIADNFLRSQGHLKTRSPAHWTIPSGQRSTFPDDGAQRCRRLQTFAPCPHQTFAPNSDALFLIVPHASRLGPG